MTKEWKGSTEVGTKELKGSMEVGLKGLEVKYQLEEVTLGQNVMAKVGTLDTGWVVLVAVVLARQLLFELGD
jgi:hypothetical protein